MTSLIKISLSHNFRNEDWQSTKMKNLKLTKKAFDKKKARNRHEKNLILNNSIQFN